ncbi:MAG: hypothetical protein WC884_04255 [Candidatus Paceibacterota bacterium]
MSNKESKAFKIGRNAKTGELATVEKAKKDPDHYVVEHMPKKGHGDTK